MSRLNDLRQFDSSQWRSLDKVLERLEQALDRGEAVDLNAFLPPEGSPSRMAYLLELIRTEISIRYRQHRGLPLETYLKKYPELGPKDLVPVSLIYEEYRARQLNGECPPLSLYKERFPDRYSQLLLLLDDRPLPRSGALAEKGAGGSSGTPRPETDRTPGPDSPLGAVHATPHEAATSGLEGAVRPSPSATPANSDQPGRGTVAQNSAALRVRAYLPTLNLGEGGYELAAPALGKGEFGEVFKAVAPGGVLVAVKRLFRPLDHSATQADLIALDKISQLNHPYLLQTHCYGQADNRLVIVMELADGSLLDRFKFHKEKGERGIPVAELIPYFTQAAQALDYLHGEKLMHRDIKPQNLLQLKGFAKVADFGLARTQTNDMSRVTMMCGTPLYMPPEAWNQLSSIHSDQYSLAATYVEMRLGRPLFQCGNPFELIRMHTLETPKLEPLPAAEQRVLLKALAKEPDERYPSCVAFVEGLARATAPPPPPPPPVGSGRMQAILLAFTLVLALAALGGVGWVLTRMGHTPPPPIPPTPPGPRVDWQPAGWRPVVPVAGGEPELTRPDWQGKTYYKRLVREVHGQTVEVVAIPQEDSSDPPTFYMMTNKVWNALFTAFTEGDKDNSERLFERYSKGPGCEKLIQRQWTKGGINAEDGKDLGTGPGTEQWPVLRVTVTEAHCFAEWLGELPSRTQWLKAAGALDNNRVREGRVGPYEGKPNDPEGMPIHSPRPWKVTRGDRDVSRLGCRQMACNGQEWTRSEWKDNRRESDLIPLEGMAAPPRAITMGQSYDAEEPLTFEQMTRQKPETEQVDVAKWDIGFRIVVQRE